MRVLVCGGRNYRDWDRIDEVLGRLHRSRPISLLIHGAAKGAESLADAWAVTNGVQPVACPVLWNYFGPEALARRNHAVLLLQPERVIAFPGGRGTAETVAQARMAGIHVVEVAAEEIDSAIAAR